MKISRTQVERFRRIKTLDQIQVLDPLEFELFVGWLYQREGYSVRTTHTTGDQGIDLRLQKGTQRIIVQCKRYAGTVGEPTVRDLYGAMHHSGATGADLVTSGRISHQAESWAAGKPIRLIDGYDLVAWVNATRRRRIATRQSPPRWLLMGAILLAILVLTSGAAAAGMWMLNQNFFEPVDQPVLVIPTREGTPDPNQENAEQPAVNQPVATVTLPGDPPPASGEAAGVEAPFIDSSPVVDGDLDEWGDIPSFTAPFRVYTVSNWDGTDDLAAVWRVAWNADALFFAVQVVDDRHVQTQTGPTTFKGDSLDIQLDVNRAGDFGPGVSPDDYQLAFSPGNFSDLPPEAYRFRGNNNGQMVDFEGHRMLTAARQTTDGYVLEGRIPWDDIGLSPEEGLVLGANFNASDNDSGGIAIQEVMISNVASRTFRDPTTWGTLMLVGGSN